MTTLVMKKFISILFFVSLIGFNVYIYFTTEKKILSYSNSPPFRMEDFTKSYRKNKNSQIKYLTDKDKTTFWIKEQNSFHPSYDLELELTLTHIYTEEKFKKKEFHSVTFYSCLTKENKSILRAPNQLEVDVFLREAINVDKELRLPTDTKIGSFGLDFADENKKKIDIGNLFNLTDSTHYPENIFLLTLFIKDKSQYKVEGKTCIAEIEVD
jgi:hypothetical protein